MTDPEKLCLEAQYGLLGRLTAGVAHQLRNSINASRNGAQVLQERKMDPAFCVKLLPVIIEAGKKMEQVLQSFERLNVSPSSGTDLASILAATLDLLALHSAGVELERLDWAEHAYVSHSANLYPALLYLVDVLLAEPKANTKIRLQVQADTVEIVLDRERGAISCPLNSLFEKLGGQVVSGVDGDGARVVVSLPSDVRGGRG